MKTRISCFDFGRVAPGLRGLKRYVIECKLLDTKSYPTKKEAFDKACPEGYVDTIKINWSE